MCAQLHLLLLAQRPSEREWIVEQLRIQGCTPSVDAAATETEIRAALVAEPNLIVIAEPLAPLTPARVLALLSEHRLDIPCLLLCEAADETGATAALELGIVDYVCRDRPQRLAPAIRRAICDSKVRAEKRQIEQALQRSESRHQTMLSEERFSKAFHGSPLPASIVTVNDGRYIDLNHSLAVMLGRSREEILGRTALEMGLWVTPEDRQHLVQLVTKHCAARNFETQLRVAGGEIRDVLISAELIVLGPEDCMIVVTQDITERKRAEASLRESEERFRQLADNMTKVFWITDPKNTRMIYVSPAYEQIWGRTCASLYAAPSSWLESVHPEDQDRLRRGTIRDGTDECIYRIVRPDGAVRWIRDRAFPLKEASGEVRHVGGIAEDITEQRGLEEQLRQAQKMEAVGQLAGGIAHDFNNLLTIIQGHASLMADGTNSKAAIEEAAEQISIAAERAASLTRQLLTFSRRQRMQARNLDLNEVIERTGKMLRRILGEDIELVFEHAPALPLVQADAGMIEQVLLNLAVNSRDAMPDGGRLQISTAAVVVTHALLQQMPEATPGPAVSITVADTGSGIAPEHLPRIFEPFFTTKDVGKGTGLGLATAYGIINQHKGWIQASSQLGQGTTFQIFLPASKSKSSTDTQPAGGAPVRGGNELILLVEDEHTLRVLVRGVLERYGYRVIEACSGKNALELWAECRQEVQLLLTDMVMPDGLTGRQLADMLRADNPELKVIYTSGYSAELAGKGLILGDGFNFLQKPYEPRLLAKTVRACLDATE